VSTNSPPGQLVDLSGGWRAHAADPDLAKDFADPALDDAAWQNVRVPHHWRGEPAFAASDGPLLYRRRFTCAAPAAEDRAFVAVDGCYYYGDVWLDGEYLGATEGSFVAHTFEVTDALRAGSGDHVLALEVACPPPRDRTAKRMLTGPFWQSSPSLLDPELNPGGIWRPVRIIRTGPVRIAGARVLCVEASVERGRLQCSVTLDAGDAPLPVDALLHTVLRGPGDVLLVDVRRDVTLAAGVNELSWTLSVDEPPRWWPRRLGPQPLCTIEIAVEIGGVASDTRTMRTAFREVRRRHSQCFVNGEPMYLKGANYGPVCALPADADDAVVRADVERALDANLDFLRVNAHVAPDVLYDTADEVGLLLWQDLPMQGGYARGVRKQATKQARDLVDLLGHRPSVFLWCAHDAPLGDDSMTRIVAGATVPTWGKDVLDRSVAHAFGRADPTRPVVAHAGAGDDAHLWFGWLHGDVAGLAPAVRAFPRLGRFVSALGAQSVPATSDWIDTSAWPDLDWEQLAQHHAMQRGAFDTHVPPADAKSFEEWRDASQAYQAALLQLQIEDLRRVRGAPNGGFAVYTFADPSPAIGYGLLDHARVPKRAFAAVRDACRPVLPMIDPRTGNVHVVNDERIGLDGITIEVVIDGRARRWGGDISAGDIAYVGSVDLGDAVDVEVSLTHAAIGRVVNRYPLLILEAGRRVLKAP
jgi:beta-mannosidase